ncbi:adhesion G-protein coupled receptor G1 [Carettochelys insculpta]|uniref:adhesion G-protein coupled receptor G1 n=1 Tax=Carettochelys insculpta TaxID=44489 RepID=UPI003EBA410A
MGKLPTMDCLLLALLFLLQGAYGSRHKAEGFRFCGERTQRKKSHLVYESKAENITIENRAERLMISAPFPANPENRSLNLQESLGKYLFCLYWYKEDRKFILAYGGTNYTLSDTAEPSFDFSTNVTVQNTSGDPVLNRVSYSHDKSRLNNSLSSASSFSFRLHASAEAVSGARSVSVHEVEKHIMKLENDMKNPNKPTGRQAKARTSYDKLLHLESDLKQVTFAGGRKTFGKSAVRATVWKIGPNQASQDLPFTSPLEADRAVQGFAVTLPSILFAPGRVRERNADTRVLLLDINSQAFFQDQNGSRVLGEKVIGITVGSSPVSGLSKKVVLTFFHNQLLRNETAQCVFWDVDASTGHGSWKSDGCETEIHNNQTICRCNHLTYFAMLMVSSPEIDRINHNYLTVLSYVGCIISAVASLCTIFFCYCSRRKHREDATTIYIHMNLLGAIFLLDVSFLISEPLASTGNEEVCKAGGMFLHYFLLCCLMWMGIEGYRLYRLVVQVFNTYVEHLILKLCLVGWGVPIFIVGVISIAGDTNYGSSPIKVVESQEIFTNVTMCWINSPLVVEIVNKGLLSLVFLFNAAMLGAMLWEIRRQRNKGRKLKYAVVLLGLSIMLGMPWALIFFSYGSLRTTTVYLFSIANSCQGFLIFFWYWMMVLPCKESQSLQSSSDSDKLHSSTSRTSAY